MASDIIKAGLEALGYRKAKDLVAYEIDVQEPMAQYRRQG